MSLPEPVAHTEQVIDILRRLSERVCAKLKEKQHAARGFRLTVRCVDTGEQDLSIGFASPAREPKAILRQFARPVDALKLPFGADGFRLLALDTQVFTPTQIVIGNEDVRSQAALEQTLTTLGNRIGFDRVRCPVSNDTHAPEREHASVEVVEAVKAGPLTSESKTNTLRRIGPGWDTAPRHVHPRPALSFAPERLHILEPGRPPRRFQWRGEVFALVSHDGPERVSPIWWDAPQAWLSDRLRDYWRALTDTGRRMWLLTCPQAPEIGWFVAGEFI